MPEYHLQCHQFTQFASVLGESPSLMHVILASKQEVFRHFHLLAASLVMLQSSSEPQFKPELLQTGPKSGSRFGIAPELNWKSGSRFRRGPNVVNLVQTEPDPEPVM